MRSIIVSLGFVVAAASIGGAERTWTGAISDSHCGMKHPTEFRGSKITERECILGKQDGSLRGCINGGAEYILVADGKVYKIKNQDFAGLKVHAAHSVRITGELAGDTITVTNITMAGKQNP